MDLLHKYRFTVILPHLQTFLKLKFTSNKSTHTYKTDNDKASNQKTYTIGNNYIAISAT